MMAPRKLSLLLASLLCLASFAEKNSFLGPNGLPQNGTEGCHDASQIEEREKTIGMLFIGRNEICTGTLISPHVVLTAAHCIAGNPISGIRFTLSADPKISGTRFVPAVSAVVHPQFSRLTGPRRQRVDLALVELESTEYGAPPKAYYSVGGGEAESMGTTAQVIGYGIDKKGILGTRRTKSVTLERTEKGGSMLRVSNGANEEHPCQGDSGGPVLKFTNGRMRILGVFSWAAENIEPLSTIGGIGTPGGRPAYLCRATAAEFATWVDSYRDWVETNRQAHESDKSFKLCP